jgi:hypothetical protein
MQIVSGSSNAVAHRRSFTRGFVAVLITSAVNDNDMDVDRADALYNYISRRADPNAILNGKVDSLLFNVDAEIRALMLRKFSYKEALWYVSAVTGAPVVTLDVLLENPSLITTYRDGSTSLQPVLGGKRGSHTKEEKIALVGEGYTQNVAARGMPFYVDGADPSMFEKSLDRGYSVHALEGTFSSTAPEYDITAIVMPAGTGKTSLASQEKRFVDIDDIIDAPELRDEHKKLRAVAAKTNDWTQLSASYASALANWLSKNTAEGRIFLIHSADMFGDAVKVNKLFGAKLKADDLRKVIAEREEKDEQWAQMTRLNNATSEDPAMSRDAIRNKAYDALAAMPERHFSGTKFDNRNSPAFESTITSIDGKDWALMRNTPQVVKDFVSSISDGEDSHVVHHLRNHVTIWIQGSILHLGRRLNPKDTISKLQRDLTAEEISLIDEWAPNTWKGWSPGRVLKELRRSGSPGLTFWTKNTVETKSQYSNDYKAIVAHCKNKGISQPLVQCVYDQIGDSYVNLLTEVRAWLASIRPRGPADVAAGDRVRAFRARQTMKPLHELSITLLEDALAGGIVFLPVQFSATSSSGLLGSRDFGAQLMPYVDLYRTIARLPDNMKRRLTGYIKTWYKYCQKAIDRDSSTDGSDRTLRAYTNMSPFCVTTISKQEDGYPFRYARHDGKYILSSRASKTYTLHFTPAGEAVRGMGSVLTAAYGRIGVGSTMKARFIRAQLENEALHVDHGNKSWWGSPFPKAKGSFFVSGHVMAMMLMPMHEFTVVLDELLANYINKESSYAAPFVEPQKGQYHTRMEYIAGVYAINRILRGHKKRKFGGNLQGIAARSAILTNILTDPGWKTS